MSARGLTEPSVSSTPATLVRAIPLARDGGDVRAVLSKAIPTSIKRLPPAPVACGLVNVAVVAAAEELSTAMVDAAPPPSTTLCAVVLSPVTTGLDRSKSWSGLPEPSVLRERTLVCAGVEMETLALQVSP